MKSSASLQLDRVEGQTLYFRNGLSFQVPLSNLRYHGQITAKTKLPFLVISGRELNGKDSIDRIFVHSPSDGRFETKTESKGQIIHNGFPYPKKYYNTTDGFIGEGRVYFGEITQRYYGLVAYLLEIYHDESTGAEVLIDLRGNIKIIGDKKIIQPLVPVNLDNNSLQINELENKVRSKKCNKIEGIRIRK